MHFIAASCVSPLWGWRAAVFMQKISNFSCYCLFVQTWRIWPSQELRLSVYGGTLPSRSGGWRETYWKARAGETVWKTWRRKVKAFKIFFSSSFITCSGLILPASKAATWDCQVNIFSISSAKQFIRYCFGLIFDQLQYIYPFWKQVSKYR